MATIDNFDDLPKVDIFMVAAYLSDNKIVDSNGINPRRTRSSARQTLDGFIVEQFKIERDDESDDVCKVEGLIFTNDNQLKKKGKPIKEEGHKIKVKVDEKKGKIENFECEECILAKVDCKNTSKFLMWLQKNSEDFALNENPKKRIKMEMDLVDSIQPLSLKQIKLEPLKKTKIKAETTEELEAAGRVSLISLIKNFKGNTAESFLEFCTEKMLLENCSKVEELTREQADTDIWHELRKGRITASRMHEVSRCTMLKGSLADKIMGLGFGFSFAMKRGTILEEHVFDLLQKGDYPKLEKCGLVLDPNFPWMGASPDGLCDEFVLEIKCPYTKKTHENYVDVKKLSRKYFAQIQLQMHMTHKTKALLAVAAVDFEVSKEITKVWIDYDKEYVDNIMEESLNFWMKAIFPALMKKRKM